MVDRQDQNVIKRFEDSLLGSELARGLYDAMSKGIKLAWGDWINYMNADDGFHEHSFP